MACRARRRALAAEAQQGRAKAAPLRPREWRKPAPVSPSRPAPLRAAADAAWGARSAPVRSHAAGRSRRTAAAGAVRAAAPAASAEGHHSWGGRGGRYHGASVAASPLAKKDVAIDKLGLLSPPRFPSMPQQGKIEGFSPSDRRAPP